ncbi:MAG: cytochrome c biogenesis protein CcsA [Rhodothermales bacterium]|nr:cytochrome c biogenesis protein CcsA [Rhodothermales bacterium]
MAGTVGFTLILACFVGAVLSAFSFFKASGDLEDAENWRLIGRRSWLVSYLTSVAAFGLLIYLIFTHQFQYAYVYENTSRALPYYFLLSSSWAGQEGSFLLWIMMNGVVGLCLMKWAREFEPRVMTVVATCQVFLVSMIIGLSIGPLHLGSSPFATLAEKFPEAPMLRAGLITADGSGLNDLLQNIWMVIHPPTLFTGFASMIAPFAFAVAALWKRDYTSWVRPALPWTLSAVVMLGVGIAMGGYWAYVTLSFGGYWAWDPVENSSLVPWLIGIAAVHMMIVQKRSGRSHKAAFLLTILAYMFVVYSTFLTRSGILGDVSVHSFVDLGLYNQLLLWIVTMGAIGFGLFAYRYREMPAPDKEPNFLSREFMIFLGAMLLSALAAVVILGTSAPILGNLFRDNAATVPIAFYNKWALPLSIGFVFLCGIGQLFWWNKMNVENLNRALMKPVLLSVAATILVILLTPFIERTSAPFLVAAGATGTEAGLFDGLTSYWQRFGAGLTLLALVFVSFFALFGNAQVLYRIGRGNPRLAGGALSHIGFAIMVLGIISSGAFSTALSGRSGVDLTGSGQRNNFILERGQTTTVNGYRVTYADKIRTKEGRPQYILNFVDPKGKPFTIEPVVYKSNKEQWIQHPDLRIGFQKDVFVAVTPNDMLTTSSDAKGEISMSRGETKDLDDGKYSINFENYEVMTDSEYHTDSTEIAVAAVLNITNKDSGESQVVKPLYLVDKNGSTKFVRNEITEWELALSFIGMDVNNGTIKLFVEGAAIVPADWIVVQAYEKPFIFLVWLGIITLSLGFVVSIVRRVKEQDQFVARAEKASGAPNEESDDDQVDGDTVELA